ncbi:glycosyltransferase family 4 protein [Nocardioides soli]|uniref:Glycosyltransferase involved in cell wall biosynthesis n=1 Tax=Nocardioides soli TaxID=1036020 RepID=A0A7W4VUW4_9ACTN|nr:glycosyltransferase family 4 protein [Nocardioides soli]MBB3042236.1 glycosyltransferase involved in cell wall biosynthesis [Nocardioides soli]
MTQRVLMLAKAFPPVTGGIETFSEQVARAYLRAKVRVDVITQTTLPAGRSEVQYPEGYLQLLNAGPGPQAPTGLRLSRLARELLKSEEYAYIHATSWRAGLATLPVRRGVPLFVSVHGREVLIVPRAMRPLMRATFRQATAVAAVSTATKQFAYSMWGDAIGADSWRVIGNGLSFPPQPTRDHTEDMQARPLRILTLARLVPRKNVQGCLSALAQLTASGRTDFEYRIAGSGPLADELRQQSDSLRLSGQVRFLGRVPDADVAALYRWADVFLHPQVVANDGTDVEGFGITIADAMSFGCAVIAGDKAGPSDFITDQRTGYLVDGNDPQAIQQAVRRLLDDRGLARSLGSAGQQSVTEMLSWDDHVKRVLEIMAPQPGPAQAESRWGATP